MVAEEKPRAVLENPARPAGGSRGVNITHERRFPAAAQSLSSLGRGRRRTDPPLRDTMRGLTDKRLPKSHGCRPEIRHLH